MPQLPRSHWPTRVVELCEGPFWAVTMFVARADTMAATGILTTGGNAGGLIGIPIVAYRPGRVQWTTAFRHWGPFLLRGRRDRMAGHRCRGAICAATCNRGLTRQTGLLYNHLIIYMTV